MACGFPDGQTAFPPQLGTKSNAIDRFLAMTISNIVSNRNLTNSSIREKKGYHSTKSKISQPMAPAFIRRAPPRVPGIPLGIQILSFHFTCRRQISLSLPAPTIKESSFRSVIFDQNGPFRRMTRPSYPSSGTIKLDLVRSRHGDE